MQAARRPLLESLAVFAVAAIFLCWRMASNVYEGDDINSLVPMTYLEAARAGGFLIYRYAWQPLSYEAGAALYRLTGSLWPVQAMAAVAVAAAIALWFGAARQRAAMPVVAILGGLLLYPELVYSGLYYNSSALAYPFAVIAVLLVTRPVTPATAILAALALTVSALLRFDFILLAPVLLVLCWFHGRSVALCALCVVATGVFFGIAILTGLLDPVALFETWKASSAEMAERAHQPGWDLRARIWVLTVALSPAGWAILALAGVHQAWQVVRGRQIALRLAVVVALMPALSVLGSFLSAKYLLPVMAVLPALAIDLWPTLGRRWRQGLTVFVAAAGLFLVLASADPQREPPFFSIATTDARQIGTHDGPRSYGAYAWQLRTFRKVEPTEAPGRAIAEAVRREGTSLVVAIGDQNYFDPAGPAWRDAVLDLTRGPHEVIVRAPGLLEVRTPTGSLLLATRADLVPAGSADCVLDLTTRDAAARIFSAPLPC